MARYIKKILGKAPGTLIHIGERKAKKVVITIIDYDHDSFVIKETKNVTDIFADIPENTKRWINISGLHDTKLIEQVGEHFAIHPIALENVVNTTQRIGFDDFDDFIHIVVKLAYLHKNNSSLKTDQVSLIMGGNYLITFMEQKTDIFEPVLNRFKKAQSKIRKLGIDYLGYAILDLIVDNYFVVIEAFERRVERLEKNLISSPTPEKLQEIQRVKLDLISLRKSIWPCREVAAALQTTDSELINSEIDIYIKNLYDHTIQVADIIDTLRDVTSGMLDIYLSSVSYEMSKVMKVLTIIATIFIPLSFIAGIYGMNFDTKSPFNLPELGWRYGYFYALGIMAIIAILMMIYFKRKKWL